MVASYTDAGMAHRKLATLWIVAALSLQAHHGSSISYHTDQTITLNGTVTEWEFINPHPQLYFDVKNKDGMIEHWASELLPTPSMMRGYHAGWSRNTIKPGDQIVLVCNPPRAEGAKACLAKQLSVNGKDLPVGPGAPGRAGAKGAPNPAAKGKTK